MQETYFYGQGKVKLAEIVAGVTGLFQWVGDVSALSLAFTEEKATHQESYTGRKGKVRDFNVTNDMTLSATFHDFGSENAARFTRGTATDSALGTVTSEQLANPIIVGTEYSLEHPGVSGLIITDSTGSPVTIDEEHYELEAAYGNLIFKSLPTSPAPTYPLKAAYSYAASKQVAFLNANQKQYALRYEGINLAEGGAPVIVECYKLSAGLLSQLDLITSGNALAGMQVAGSVLLDTRKPAVGLLGQYGRIIQVAA